MQSSAVHKHNNNPYLILPKDLLYSIEVKEIIEQKTIASQRTQATVVQEELPQSFEEIKMLFLGK